MQTTIKESTNFTLSQSGVLSITKQGKSCIFRSLKKNNMTSMYQQIVSLVKVLPVDLATLYFKQLGQQSSLETQGLFGYLSNYGASTEVGKFLQKTHDAVNRIDKFSNVVIRDYPKVMKYISDTMRSLEIFSDTRTFLIYILDIASFFLALYYKVPMPLIITAGAKLLLTHLSPHLSTLVQTIVKHAKDFASTLVPQAKTGSITAMIEFARSLVGLQEFDDKDTLQMINKLRAQIGLLKDTKYIWSFIKGVFVSAMHYFQPELFTDNNDSLLTKWEAFSIELNKPDLEKRYGTDPEFATTLRKYNSQIIVMRKAFMDAEQPIRERYKMMSYAYTGAMTMVVSLENSFKNRIKPVIVHFHGPAGCGKSTLVSLLADELHRLINNVSNEETLNPTQIMYSVNLNDKFRDSYNCQTVWYYDDPNQNKDIDVLMNFFTELIQVGNDVPYKLDCSSIEGKAGTYFSSPFAMFTTNGDLNGTLQTVDSKLQSAEAVRRRITFEVKVQAVPQSIGKDRYILTVSKYKEYQDKTMSYHDFLLELIAAYSANVQDKKLIKSTAGTSDEMRQKFKELVPQGMIDFYKQKYRNWSQGYLNCRNNFLNDLFASLAPLSTHTNFKSVLVDALPDLNLLYDTNPYCDWELTFNDPGPMHVGNPFYVVHLMPWVDDQGHAHRADTLYLVPGMKNDRKIFIDLWAFVHLDNGATFAPDQVGIYDHTSFNAFAQNIVSKWRVSARNFNQQTNRWISTNASTYSTTPNVVKDFLTANGHNLFHDVKDTTVAIVNSAPVQYFLNILATVLSIRAAFLLIDTFAEFWVRINKVQKKQRVTQEFQEDVSPQVDYPKDLNGVRPAKSKPIVPRKLDMHTQGENETSLIASNIWHASWSNHIRAECRASLKVLFLRQGFCVVPKHFFYQRKDETHLRLVRFEDKKGVMVPFDYVIMNSVSVGDEDLVLIDCTPYVQCRDITPHMLTDKEIATLIDERMDLHIRSFDKPTKIINAKAEFSRVPVEYRNEEDVVFQLSHSFRFAYPTQKGYCGSPYILEKSRFKGCLVGIHVAGDAHTGLGTVISRETLYKCIASLALEPQSTTQGILEAVPDERVPKLLIPGKAKFIKIVPKDQIAFIPNKSNIEMNPEFYELLNNFFQIPEDRAPAALRAFELDGQIINPLQNALNKIGDVAPQIEPEHLLVYKKVMDLYVKTWPEGKSIQLLDEHSVLNGIAGTSFKAINMRRSAGINHLPSFAPGKFSYVVCLTCAQSEKCTCLVKNWSLTQESRKVLNDIESTIRKGQKVDMIFQGCLKDELRPMSKVLAGKTRLFSVGPFELLYLVRKYFGHFMEVFISNPMAFGSGIGLNPHSNQWRLLYEHLNVFQKILASDAEGWDYSISIDLIRVAIEAYVKWYGETYRKLIQRRLITYCSEDFEIDQRSRVILGEMSHCAYLLVGDTLLYMELVFSGHPMTGITNTVINNVATRAAVVIHHKEVLGQAFDPSFTFENLRLTATGDDIVVSHCFPNYTNHDHALSMQKLGIKLTPFDKKGEFSDYYTIDQVDYLKRKFVLRDGHVFAPLSKQSLIGAINWKHVGMSSRVAARANYECMLVEAMHHGEEFYDDIRIVVGDHYANCYRDQGNNILPSIDYKDMVNKMQGAGIDLQFVVQSSTSTVDASAFSIDDVLSTSKALHRGSANRTKHKIMNKLEAKHRKYEGKPASLAMKKTYGPNSDPENRNLPGVRRVVKPDRKQYIVLPNGQLIYELTLPDLNKPVEPKKINPFVKKDVAPRTNFEAKSSKTEEQMIMDDWGEKPHRFLKEKNASPTNTSSRNKEDDDIKAIERLVPSLNVDSHNEDTDDGPSPQLLDYDEKDCDQNIQPEKPKKFYRVQPYSQELSDSFKNPDMTKQSRNIHIDERSNSLTSNIRSKTPNMPSVSKQVRSNLKRVFRPRIEGDVQATTLLRYLGTTELTMKKVFEELHVHRYRNDKVFKNTNLHFSYVNLVEVCRPLNIRFTTETFSIPDFSVPGLKVILKHRDREVSFACAFDIDEKNRRKFAYWNAIIELSMKGYSTQTFAQANTGEKLPVADMTEMTSLNSKIQEDGLSVGSQTNQQTNDIIRTLDPYPDMTPHNLLERQLLVASFSISSTRTKFSNLITLEMPYTFTSIPFWNDLLARFNRCIFDVEIEARLNANMMQQGLLLWAHSPGIKPSNQRTKIQTTAPLQILQDITTSPTVKFTVKGVTYLHGFDQRALPLTDAAHVGGLITCDLLSPIRESNSTAPLSVLMTVYAKLINVRAFGFRTQSRTAPEAMPKGVQMMAMPVANKIQENMNKADKGISATLDTLSEVSGVVSNIPQAAPYAASISALTGLASKVTRYFGYSNSRDVSGPGPALPRSVNILSTNHGTLVTDVHALAVDSMISTDKSVIKDEVDYNLYDNFKLRPSLTKYITLTPATAVGTITTFSVGPQYETLDATDSIRSLSASYLLAKQHQMWRGGMKYKCVVVCNRFVSFRLRVYWRPNGTEALNPSVVNVSNFANRIINVSGPTTFEFSVPYLALTPGLYTTNTPLQTSANGAITIELLTSIQVQGTVPVPIDILIWSSCAEDTIFSRPVQYYGEIFAQSGMEGNDVVSSFRTIFEPIIDAQTPVVDKVNFSDVTSSFTERHSKFHYWKSVAVTPSVSGAPVPGIVDLRAIINDTAGFDAGLLSTLFSAHRGSYNLMFIPRTVSNHRFAVKSVVGNVASTDGPFGVEPCSFGDHQNKQIITMTFPYYNLAYYAQPFFADSLPTLFRVEVYCFSDGSTTPVQVDILLALGEDYSLGHATTLPVHLL